MKKTILILFMILSNLVFGNSSSSTSPLPIYDAVKNNDIKTVKYYLENDLKGKGYENELLSDAVYYNLKEMEVFLLGRGATYDGALLSEVDRSENLDKLEKILKKGANPNLKDEFGYTALYRAVRGNKIKIVKLLLKYGGDPNIKNNDGKTAYDLAGERGYTEILKVLPKIEGDYIFKSKVHNVKEWLANHIWWLPDIYAQKMFEAITFPPLAAILLVLAYVINFGLPIVLIFLVIKIYRKYKKNKKEKK